MIADRRGATGFTRSVFYFEDVREKDYLYIETMKVLYPNAVESDRRRNKASYLRRSKEE